MPPIGPHSRPTPKKPKRKRYVAPAGRSDAAQRTGAREQRRTRRKGYKTAVNDSPGSDAAQRAGAQTQAKAEARNRGRSDAAAPAGAAGYRMTAEERRVRDREILQARRRVLARRRQAGVKKFFSDVVSVGSQGTPTPRGRRLPGATVAASGGLDRAAPLGLLPTRAARGIAGALIEDPAGTSKNTARGFKDALVGAPGAALETAIDTVEGTADGDPLRGVKRAGKAYVEDVVRRYKPLLDGPDGERKFKERLKKEGVSAEAFDALGLVAGPGGAASRGVGAAARAGKLGKRAERVASEPRRRERTSGGESREQERSPGFFKVQRQKKRDEAAYRGQQRQTARADKRATRPKADGTTDRGKVDAVVREATDRGEVVPSKITGVERRGRHGVGVRRAPSGRKIAKRERVQYAKRKGRALHALRRVERAEGIAGAGRGAGRAYASLSAPEKVAYKAAIQGPRTPAAGKAWAEARIRRIEAAIERGDVDASEARELRALRAMAAEPGKHFTEHLAAVAAAEVERGKRAAAGDPRLGETVAERERTAELRRRAPAFTILGVKREGRTTAQAERVAREQRDRGRKDRARAERALRGAERRVGAAEETARRLAASGKQRDAEAVVRSERAVEIHTRAAANHRRRAERSRSAKMRAGHTSKAEAAEERAAAAGKRTADAIGRAESSPRLRKRVSAARGRREEVKAEIARAEQTVKAAAKEGRRAAALRRKHGRDALDPRTAEDVGAFLERGRRATDEAGLSEPGFFQSVPREARRFSLFTTGGFRHVPKDRRYKGTLFEQGREDGSFTSYAQGLARNFKAAHNWSLIEDTVREHGFAWSRNKSVEEIRRELERRGIDESTVAFWNPGVFREAGAAVDGGETIARIEDTDAILRTPDVVGETLDVGQAQMAAAVRLATDTGRFAESRDWIAVPKGLMDELEADTRPSHWFWRGLDVVKGKQARILLGTSPAWLQFQIASNMLLTTMAGVGPLEIVRAQRWWKRLSDEEKAAVEPYVGVGHFHDSRDQVQIGAAANGRVLNGWRAFKAADFWHKPRRLEGGGSISQLNPLDALFRVDNAQNNVFRRAVLYNRVKRDAYARMGANVSVQQRALDRLVGHFRYTKPEQTMSALVRDHKVIARHAEAVNDFLGDYLTYTARERRILGRSVMFYGFLRFSLRFSFYTMPVKHPVMTSIIGQLGQLQTEEVRRLLGGNEMPWAMGKFFYTRDGKLKSINVARANPFLNTVTELDLSRDVTDQARNALRFLPPVYVALLDQAFSKSSFTNKDYRVEGETSGRGALGNYGIENRARIFLNDMARLNAIYRAADRGASGGVPQGDDSLLGDRPTVYKRADIVAGIAESAETFKGRGGFWGSVQRDVLPVRPGEDDSPEIAAKIRQARGEAAPVKLTPEQRREVDALKREAAAAGPSVELDAAELRKLRREALAGG